MKLGTYLTDCAQRFPDKDAAVCAGERITFGELERKANQFAHALADLGHRPGERVALYLPNGLEVVVAMAGVARLGGIIVPISSRLAAEEVRHILKDSQASCLVYHQSLAADLAALRPEVSGAGSETELGRSLRSYVQVSANRDAPIAPGDETHHDFDHLLASGKSDPPELGEPPNDDLVIGYTSGTSGLPKGAVGTHGAMVMSGGYMCALEYNMRPADRILITSPMAHRVGLSRVVNMLCIGCSIVIMPSFDSNEAVALIEQEQVTIVSVVPTIARLMAPAIEANPNTCRTLRCLLATGEAFPVELKDRLLSALPHLQLFTAYAQTEGGLMTCLRPEEQRSHPTSIGRPLPGVEVKLVDDQLAEVPIGEAGEFLVRFGRPGEFLTMREYYGKPEETKEAFLDGGWLRTGDICRRDEAGYYYFVDRLKDMIVTGGLNVYAKEVELALISHPSVADAAVIGVPDPEFGEAVAAFVEPEGEAVVDPLGLIEHCRTKIASYKKPKYIASVPGFARTPSGKVKKRELPLHLINVETSS